MSHENQVEVRWPYFRFLLISRRHLRLAVFTTFCASGWSSFFVKDPENPSAVA